MKIIEFMKSKVFWMTVLKMGVLSLLLLFILKYWLSCTTNHNQRIVVPDLSKMSLLKVKATLEKLDLRHEVLEVASFNPDFPPSTVVSQDPEAGDFVKQKRKIYITLNRKSYRDIEIPQLLGKTKRHVESELLSLGFKIGTYSYIPDKGKDVVRGLNFNGERLEAGDKIPKNSKINLVLGDGGIRKVVQDSIK